MSMAMDMGSSSMNMGTSTMSSGMTMSTSMPMSSSGSGMSSMGDMDGMPMSMTSQGTMMMGMMSMAMTFFTAADTPLFSMSWAPDNNGQYAGTCIFLIALATIFRFLLAVRCNLGGIRTFIRRKHDTEILHEVPAQSDGKNGLPVRPTKRRWNINEALTCAVIDTTIAGVGYLLMIAVMTMNVGYFMSVLGGTFLGSFCIAHRAGPAASGH